VLFDQSLGVLEVPNIIHLVGREWGESRAGRVRLRPVEPRLPLDQARLRPHLREHHLLLDEQAAVFRREHERASEDGAATTSPGWKTSAGDVDHERMRGLPLIARGVRGAQKGSDPVAETIRRSERGGAGRKFG
jgi:hypothetical protein